MRTALSHLSAVLSTSKPPPQAIHDRLFSWSGTIGILVIFWATAGPSGVRVSLRGKTLQGERREYFLGFGKRANSQVFFSGTTVCSLSERKRQVCVWLSHHLRPLFASVSAARTFLPVSLPELMMNYEKGLALLENTDVFTHAHLIYWGLNSCGKLHHTGTEISMEHQNAQNYIDK